jgi:hypothetical protein
MVSISSPAAGSTTGKSPNLVFSSGSHRVGATQCSLDGNRLASCASGDVLSVTTSGQHTVSVTVTDVCKNTGTASSTWTVATTGPTVSIAAPAADSTVAGEGVVSYSVGPGATTVTCSFDGTEVPCNAAGGSFPYSTTQDGSHTATVTATDMFGNSNTASVTFITDVSPPIVTSLALVGPAAQGNASFVFTLSDASDILGVTCAIDGVPHACGAGTSGSVSFDGLATGDHTVDVYGIDIWGNSGSAVPAGRAPSAHVKLVFFEDASAPLVTALAQGSPQGNGNASFTFTLTDDTGVGAVTCVVDSGAPVGCGGGSGALSYDGAFAPSGLITGTHTLEVYAVDVLGNSGAADPAAAVPAPHASLSFSVDASPPLVTALSQTDTAPTFGFTLTDPSGVATAFCVIDGGTPVSCATGSAMTTTLNGSYGPSGLAGGGHTLEVYGVDALQNSGAGATAATLPPSQARAKLAFTIDNTPPVVSVLTQTSGGPSGDATFSYTITDPSGVTSVHCVLDGDPMTDSECATASSGTLSLSGFDGGAHTLDVYAIDGLGNSGVNDTPAPPSMSTTHARICTAADQCHTAGTWDTANLVCSGAGQLLTQPIGSGTSASPYVLCTATDIAGLGNVSSGVYYILGQNIDMTGTGLTGVVSNTFSGQLDGQGFAIQNLTISSTGTAALIEQLNGTVQNLLLTNLSLTATGSNADAAGVAHFATGAHLTQVGVTGTITAGHLAGGLISEDTFTTYLRCFSRAAVHGDNQAGAIVGNSSSSPSNITDTYATGTVTGNTFVGGFTGFTNNLTFTRCYEGATSITGAFPGALSADGISGFTASQSYYYQYNGTLKRGDGTTTGALSAAQILIQANFTGFDFAATWTMSSAGPVLTWQCAALPTTCQ